MTEMSNILFLEHGGARDGGIHVVFTETDSEPSWITLVDPRDLDFQNVLLALQMRHVPGTPEGILEWKRVLIFDRWRAGYELPEFDSARRLAYLVDKYRAEISHDLATHTRYDLGTLWRDRRWMLLLDILDRLPSHSWYAAAVTMDEEHTKMMVQTILTQQQAMRDRGEEPSKDNPSLVAWTPEVAVMTNVLDAVRTVTHAIIAVNATEGKTPEPPKPSPRPEIPLEKALRLAEYERKQAAHKKLVARLIPNRG